MIWKNYRLDQPILRASQDIILWTTIRGTLEIDKNTLAIPIKQDDNSIGYVFSGNGRLLIDAIVETEEGAIGRPVEKEITCPFLTIENSGEMQKYLVEADEENLARMDYTNPQEFEAEAEELCKKFFGSRSDVHRQFKGDCSRIFAFPNEESELDFLIVKNLKMVYKAKDMTFVSNDNKVVLKSPDEVVCSDNGKSVIIYKDKSVIIGK
jgi:hypothetical protein